MSYDLTRLAPKLQVITGNGDEPDVLDMDNITAQLGQNAVTEDPAKTKISHSIALLRDAGWLHDNGIAEPATTAYRLMRTGAVNLSAGRLFEGHINALYLIKVHGSAELNRDLRTLLSHGAFLGVWGADGESPVIHDKDAGCLAGSKIFASGLGTVTHAVVTVNTGTATRLALVDVTNPARSDPTTWQMPGMKATTSGTFDFDGLSDTGLSWIGGPDDYHKEPHFVGGVWRIAALQLGAAVGLIEAAADSLRDRDRLDALEQRQRLSEVQMKAAAAAALVYRAADMQTDKDAEEHVALSCAARLTTEDLALEAIKVTEQALGLGHFQNGSTTERLARDISVYLRQAARDAMARRFADFTLKDAGNVWDLIS